jgi:hypothetical protein
MKRAVLMLTLVSCASPKTWAPLDIPKFEPPATTGTRVGIAAVDVTPPPGLRLAGHDGAQRSRGLRTRLTCRAFVLDDGKDIWALVPCDLWGVSRTLSEAVVTRLQKANVPIGGERILFFGNRAPSTPAHFFETAPAAHARLTEDFDLEVVEWLADRISAALIEAYFERIPAILRWGGRELYGIFETPATVPADISDSVRARLDAKRPLSAKSFERENTPGELLVSGDLSVLRIDRPGDPGRPRPLPMALLAIYPLPVLGGPTDMYDADFSGQLSRALAAQLAHRWREECLILAGKSSTRTATVVEEASLARDVGTTVTTPREIIISGRGSTCGRDPQIAVGLLSAAAADLKLSAQVDRPTAVHDISAAILETMDDALESPVVETVNGKYSEYPLDATRAAEVAWLQIGERSLAVSPGELTSLAGLRLQAALKGATAVQSGSVVDTVDENSPDYPAVEKQLSCLQAGNCPEGRWEKFSPRIVSGKRRELLPLDPEVIHDSFNERLPVTLTDRNTWEMRWWGPEPGFLRSYHRLHVRVFSLGEKAVQVADDFNGAITIKYLDETHGRVHRWSVEWTAPAEVACGPHVFEIQGHEHLRSSVFNPCDRNK